MTDFLDLFHQLSRIESREHWLSNRQRAADYLSQAASNASITVLVDRLAPSLAAGDPLPGINELIADERFEVPSELLGALSEDASAAGHLDVAARMLIGRVAARALAAVPPTLDALNQIATFLADADWPAFAQEFASHVSDAQTWVGFLKSLKLDISSDGPDRELAIQEAERWKAERTSPFPRWRPGHLRFDEQSGWYLAITLAECLSPPTWLRMLDSLPLPELVESILWRAGVDDHPERALELLAVAPPAYSATGHRTESVIAYFLIETAFEAATRVLERVLGAVRAASGSDRQAGAETLRDQAVNQELPAWYQRIADVIAKRDDAAPVCIELAVDLTYRANTSYQESGLARERTKQFGAFATLLLNNAQPRYGLEAFKTHWELRETYAKSRFGIPEAKLAAHGLPYWLTAAEALAISSGGESAPAPEEASNLWLWLNDLLLREDPSFQRILVWGAQAVPAWVSARVGHALSLLDSPARTWERSWSSLAPQRNFARMQAANDERWGTSRFLVASGLSAIPYVQLTDEQKALWLACKAASVTIWLHSGGGDAHDCFLRMLAHLASSKLDIEGEPRASLEYLVGEADIAVRAAWALVANGVAPAAAAEAFSSAGIDLEQYASLAPVMTPAKGKPPEDLVEVLSKIAKAKVVVPSATT